MHFAALSTIFNTSYSRSKMGPEDLMKIVLTSSSEPLRFLEALYETEVTMYRTDAIQKLLNFDCSIT